MDYKKKADYKNSRSNTFGNYMKDLRLCVELSLDEAALIFNISKEMLLKWENGEELPPKELAPTLSQIFKIAESEWLEILKCEIEMRGG